MKTLFILNGPAYGSELSYNGLVSRDRSPAVMTPRCASSSWATV